MGWFGDWVKQVVESRNRVDYRRRVTPAETVSLWRRLGFGPKYQAAYCVAVCPAGDDVVAYRANKAQHTRKLLRPLQGRVETLYAILGSDAEAHARKRFPHKAVKAIRSSLLPRTVDGFLYGRRLTFQRGAAEGVDATLHFRLLEAAKAAASGSAGGPAGEPLTREATVVIREGRLGVRAGLQDAPDAAVWLEFLRGERGIIGALLTLKIRVRGSLAKLRTFERCIPNGAR